MQQPFAKGVNGLYLQSAGRFDGAGEKLTGEIKTLEIRLADLAQSRPQLVVIEFDPFRQDGKNPFLHVRGCGAGECQTQDILRIGAAQQQPDHPVRKHIGLAGTGVRAHPCRTGRIGGLDLAGENVRSECHSPFSP